MSESLTATRAFKVSATKSKVSKNTECPPCTNAANDSIANAECLVSERYELAIIVVGDLGLPDHDEAKYRTKILAAASKAVLSTGKTSSTPAGALKRLLCQTCEMVDSDVKLDDKYDTI